MTKNEEIFFEALRQYGYEAQKMMMIEECSELINALTKENRGRSKVEDIVTEIADVQIMAEQMALIYGKDRVEAEKDRKIERLRERLGLNLN